MTQENKQLLLKDLCARLPYGVKVCYVTLPDSMPKAWDLIGMPAPHLADIIVEGKYRFAACDVEENIRPYLRPMSSMTEEEREEFRALILPEASCAYEDCLEWDAQIIGGGYLQISVEDFSKVVDWLNEHHFDYRGLIEKGLAIAVTDENNPYK